VDQNKLLSSAVELGLELLETSGSFVPFCKAVDGAGETFIYTPASDKEFTNEQGYESVLLNVKRDLEPRQLKGVAFCFHSRVRLSDSEEKVPAIEVEVHYKGQPATVWYFLYKMDGSTATVLEYYKNDANSNLFS
jgi:hypothetical protein